MKRKLLISGVTLGACVLAVSVIVSSAPSIVAGSQTAQPSQTSPRASGPELSKSVLASQPAQEDTGTDQILVAFTTTPKHPETAAIKAVAPAAARIAKATVTSAKLRYTGTVAVELSKQVSHATAAKIAAKASTAAGVDYAEASLTFHPTDVSTTAGSDAWNRTAIEANKISSDDTGSGVVVGVIDTGIAANPDLPKALLVNATDGVVWNHSISGTTWPNLTVTATWGDPQRSTTTPAGADGNWAIDFDALAASASPVAAPADQDLVTLTVTSLATTTATVRVDAVVTLVVDATNGAQISGTTDKGAQVVVTDKDTNSVCTATAADDGTFQCTPSGTLNDGDQLTLTATDAVGNATTKTVTIDKTPPAAPTIDLSNGKVIHLTGAEDGITPKAFDAETGGNEIDGEWVDRTGGEWTFTPTTPLAESPGAWIRLTDDAKNTSSTPVEIDATAPDAPTIAASNGTVIHLTGVESGITPKAFDAETGGNEIGGAMEPGATAGEWTFTPTTPLTESPDTWIRLIDKAGNTTSTRVDIDATPPNPPVVLATDGQTLSGTAESGATVTVSYLDADAAKQSATATASGDGTWTATLEPRAADRSMVTATATDAVGNVSEPSSEVRVHYGPPSAPAVAPSDGTTVVVTGVLSGDVVSLVDDGGASLGNCVDNQDQSWTCTADPALSESSQAFIVVTDDAGQTSVPELVVVDTTAPVVTIDSATSTSVTGSSDEALASLTVSYVDATDQPHTATAVITGLTWSAELAAAKAGSTLTATGTDPVGNHRQVTATIAEPPSDSSPAPTPEPAPVGPAGAADDDATPETPATPQASLDTSTSAGTVLPGYNFYNSTDGSHDATDPGQDSTILFHGTHVAGIIGASGASQITGVAPGVKILPIRVLGGTRSDGDMADVADAISWGAGVAYYGATKASDYPANPYPAQVLNLSLGALASSCPTSLQNAINAAVAKGTVVVVSAGNNNASFTGQAPANCKNVIVATASTATNTRASYSNWGTSASSNAWLIAAPGGAGAGECHLDLNNCPGFVMSTTGHIDSVAGTTYDTYIWPMAGTSQAAPHVSAVAALMLAKNSALTPKESALTPKDVAQVMRATATGFSDGCPTGVCGSGVVNAAAALQGIPAGPDSGTSPTEAPATYPTAWARLFQPSVPRVGSVLSATGAVSYGAASYQWYRGTTAIARATSARYTLTAADLGQRIKVRVSGIGWNVAYSTSSATIAPGYITSLTRPKVLGTRKVGSRLKATKGTWSVSTSVYRYRWYRSGKAIRGATGRTYRLTRADRGKRITVRVYVKATGYYSRSRISSRTATIR